VIQTRPETTPSHRASHVHVEEGLDLTLLQFADSPRLRALLSALLSQLDAVEKVLTQLLDGNWLDSAEGVALDSIGRLVGQPRNGMDDTLFRLWIRARVVVNRSRGEPNDMVRVLKTLLGPDVQIELNENPIELSEAPDIGFTAFPKVALSYEPNSILNIIKESKALSIPANLQYATRMPVFAFDAPEAAPHHNFFSDIIGGAT
jgi:hypothetical protein